MKFPNPNLLRFIWPTRLQLWCARHGVLTGRWTYAEIERIRRTAADRAHKWADYDGTCGCQSASEHERR